MNPDITSPMFMKDDMGMDYIPVRQSELRRADPAGPADKGKIAFYRNPMNPAITSKVSRRTRWAWITSRSTNANSKGRRDPPWRASPRSRSTASASS